MGGAKRAVSLIAEAKQTGLISNDREIDYDNYDDLYHILNSLNDWTPIYIQAEGMDRLSYLQSKFDICQNKLNDLNEAIRGAKNFAGESGGFYAEIEHQKVRLSSIGLYEKLDFNPNKCPLCSSQVESELPGVGMIKIAIDNLNKNIQNVTRERPKLRAYIDQLEKEREEVRDEAQNIKNEIDGIYNQNDEVKKIKDLNTRRAKVIGRVSLWLESIKKGENTSEKENEIKNMEIRLNEINEKLDYDFLEERKQSALSRISSDMTKWAIELNLEHANNPYRLDMNKATVVVDLDRPVPLKQLGSGSNWVGIHLIAYFAIQKYFIDMNRPVPNFLFLDQPSQVYFPSQNDEEEIDLNMVKMLYDFIIRRTAELNGKLQVIIVDHANNQEFREYVIEDWWGENKLIPLDWYESKGLLPSK